MSLDQLEIFPLEYHLERNDIRTALVERGKKFVTLCSLQNREYHRVAQAIASSQSDPFSLVKVQVNGRVMMDCQGFYAANPSRSIALTEIIGIVTEVPELQLKEDEYLLCSNVVPSFSFTGKQWCMFEADLVRNIEFNITAFENLILPAYYKNLILSLVNRYNSRIGCEFDDIIEGKGRGLIMLLHGPPGVGKTLTAESVAEHTRRPLLTLSCGDLSTYSPSLEQNLSHVFHLANKWNAVLLIDEADVFLESRRAGEHEQNRLVSVFLRVLEYYQGILFLTTNRVGDLDVAFRSRIHLSLSYDHLSRESRRDLWRAFITRMHDEDPKWMDDACLYRLSTDELSGRQIRNVVSVANSLATSRSEERMSIDHIEEALKTTRVFPTYRSEISPKHGTSADGEPRSKRRRLVGSVPFLSPEACTVLL